MTELSYHHVITKSFRRLPHWEKASWFQPTKTAVSFAFSMTPRKRNQYLDLDSEDEEDRLSGYDSGAVEDVELSRIDNIHGAPNHSKRRKISKPSALLNDSESESKAESSSDVTPRQQAQSADHPESQPSPTNLTLTANKTANKIPSAPDPINESNPISSLPQKSSSTLPTTKSAVRPRGVIYLSRIPPFMRPSTVRSLLSQHGPITRLFLTPEPPSSYLGRRARGGNKKKSYIDGWVEFASRRDARVCTAAINAQTIGRKAGFYGNDVWNARFLKGFSWTDLMAGARAEEREREERVRIGLGREMRERKAFLNAVEKGRREVARREKREKKKADKMNFTGEHDANATRGGNPPTTTNPIPTNFPAQPSSSTNPTHTLNPSTSKSKSNPRPEMRFRQHTLAPTAARTRTSMSHKGGGGGSSSSSSNQNGELMSNGHSNGDNDENGKGMVTRILRQVF